MTRNDACAEALRYYRNTIRAAKDTKSDALREGNQELVCISNERIAIAHEAIKAVRLVQRQQMGPREAFAYYGLSLTSPR